MDSMMVCVTGPEMADQGLLVTNVYESMTEEEAGDNVLCGILSSGREGKWPF